VLRIEGTIEGNTVNDTRTSSINAGLTNIGSFEFQTPLVTASLESNQVGLDFRWAESLAYGEVSAVTNGRWQAPADFPIIRKRAGVNQVGSSFCVSKGELGFVSGGSEDGVFKFAITELWDSDSFYPRPLGCPSQFPAEGGETFAVDVRGCFR
jgi:hypothetical protein